MPDSTSPDAQHAVPDEADTTAEDANPDATAETGEEEPVFANRAARRARSKGGTPQQVPGKSVHFGRRGTVQGPRQWGNRRTG